MKNFDVAVIGTIFVDVKGFPRGTYDPRGRNIGQVRFFHGGVGRNVAETMVQLDVATTFISTVDPSGLGIEVIERLNKMGIDTSYIKQVEQGMGMWMAILNEKGDLAGSISQMPGHDQLEKAVLEQTDLFLAQSKAVALEIDLTEKIAEVIVAKAVEQQLTIYGIPGNLDVLHKRKDLLQHVQCFICNEVEAYKLTSYSVDTVEGVKKAAEAFLSMGVKQVVITLAERGCYYYDSIGQQHGFVPAQKVEVVDTTGAGDSFFAGTVAALVNGNSLELALKQGTAIAAITISSAESTCQNLKERLKQ